MIDEKKVLSRFLELVHIDSPSGEENRLREFLLEKLAYSDVRGEVDRTGNLLFRIPGSGAGKPCLFSAHMDTVPPSRGVKPIVKKDGKIHSDGRTVLGADDKDGITAIWTAFEILRESHVRHPPFEFLFTVGEETNLTGSRLIQPGWLESSRGWVFDGPGKIGTVYCNGVGKKSFTITVRGLAAHAGICPEKGLSALVKAAEGILRFPPGKCAGATFNYGTMLGGKADNIVPDEAVLTGELRSPSAAKLESLAARLATAWKDSELLFRNAYPSFALKKDSTLVQRTLAIVSETAPGKLKKFRAACDANHLFYLGIPCCIIATGRKDNHTTTETTRVEYLTGLTEIALNLMKMQDH